MLNAGIPVLLTSNEEGVSREHGLVVPIFHEPADTILSVARRVQCLDIYTIANLESIAMFWCCGNGLTVLAPNHFQPLELGQLLRLASSGICTGTPVLRCGRFLLHDPNGCNET